MRRLLGLSVIALSLGSFVAPAGAGAASGLTIGAGSSTDQFVACCRQYSYLSTSGPFQFNGVFDFGGQAYTGLLDVVGQNPDGSSGVAWIPITPSTGFGPFTLSGSGTNAPSGTCYEPAGGGIYQGLLGSLLGLPVVNLVISVVPVATGAQLVCQASVSGGPQMSVTFTFNDPFTVRQWYAQNGGTATVSEGVVLLTS